MPGRAYQFKQLGISQRYNSFALKLFCIYRDCFYIPKNNIFEEEGFVLPSVKWKIMKWLWKILHTVGYCSFCSRLLKYILMFLRSWYIYYLFLNSFVARWLNWPVKAKFCSGLLGEFFCHMSLPSSVHPRTLRNNSLLTVWYIFDHNRTWLLLSRVTYLGTSLQHIRISTIGTMCTVRHSAEALSVYLISLWGAALAKSVIYNLAEKHNRT